MSVHYGLQFEKLVEILGRQICYKSLAVEDKTHECYLLYHKHLNAITVVDTAEEELKAARSALNDAIAKGCVKAVEEWKEKNGRYPI